MRFGFCVWIALFSAPVLSQETTQAPIATVKKEVYVKNKVPGKAPWVWVYSGEPGYREEIHTLWSHETQVRGHGDSPMDPHRRISQDDGKTWSELTPVTQQLTLIDDGKVAIIDWKFCGIYDPASGKHIDLSIHHLRDMREGPPRRLYNHSLIRLSSDGGKTFGSPEMLRYEDGQDFSKTNLLDPGFLKKNTGYPGQSIFRHSNGSIIIPVTNVNIPAEVEDEPVGRTVWPEKGGIGGLCFVGRWNAKTGVYDWKAGKPVWLSRDDAFNGLLEADIAELKDGRVLQVWRTSKNGKEKPAYKYFAVSDDGGLTFTKPQVFRYSDGSHFFSTSTFHRLFRSSKTGKLYWIGNIIPEHTTSPGHPRYPLIIAEVDEKTLGLIKESVTQIDTRQPGEGKTMQLSNFWMTESQNEHNLEIYLTRLYENPDELYTANAYRYTLTFK